MKNEKKKEEEGRGQFVFNYHTSFSWAQ